MRKDFADGMRCIAMIAVFFIHCIFPGRFGIVLRAFNAFAVPFFFITSGYFCFSSSQDHIIKKAIKLLKVIILSNGFYFLWDIWFELYQGHSLRNFFFETLSIKKLLIFVIFNESPFRGHLWFLGALMCCYLLLYILLRHDKTDVSKWFIVLLIIGLVLQRVLVYISLDDKISLLVRNWLFVGIPFFFAGYNYRQGIMRLPTFLYSHTVWIVIVVCCFNILEIELTGTEMVYGLMTIILTYLLFVCAVENDNTQYIVGVFGEIYRKYGLMFYIIQVAIIKSIDLYCMKRGVIWDCIKPIIVLFISALVTAIVTETLNVVKKTYVSRKHL